MTEEINMLFCFTPIWWNDNVPQYSIWLDDKLLDAGSFKVPKEINKVERKVTLEHGDHTLRIRYENKKPSDILWSHDKKFKLRENYILFEILYIDYVKLDDLIKTESYFLHNGERYPSTVKGSINLYREGDYVLEFTSPIHYWILNKFPDNS